MKRARGKLTGPACCPVAVPYRFKGKDLVRLLEALPCTDARYLAQVERAANRQPKVPASPWER